MGAKKNGEMKQEKEGERPGEVLDSLNVKVY